jgi:sporadic carbohydrate cluster protein (TIGR04323 family)
MNNNHALGYRGYIGSRPYYGLDFPQTVQNFLIRSYCQKHNLNYLLSATEYKMSGCYMMLEEVVSGIDTLDGIVLFSIFMLPTSSQKRKNIYETLLNKGRTLHAALEDIKIAKHEDIGIVEDILQTNAIALTDKTEEHLREFCIDHQH